MVMAYYKRHGVVTVDVGEIGGGGSILVDLISNTNIKGFYCDGMVAEDSITLSACEADGTEIVKVASVTMGAAATISCPFFVTMGTVWTRYLLVTVTVGNPAGQLYIYVGSE